MNVFSVIATLLLLAHFVFVLFVVLGGWLLIRWPKLMRIHLPAACWGAWIEFMGWICPLTPWENRMRALAGQATYQDDFVQHYIIALLYPSDLTRSTQWLLGLAVILINACAYWRFWKVARRSFNA